MGRIVSVAGAVDPVNNVISFYQGAGQPPAIARAFPELDRPRIGGFRANDVSGGMAQGPDATVRARPGGALLGVRVGWWPLVQGELEQLASLTYPTARVPIPPHGAGQPCRAEPVA